MSGLNVRGIVGLAGGSAVGQLAVLAVSPLLARLFLPEELGQFGLLQAFVGFAAVGLCLRLDLAIVSADSETDADGLLHLCLALCLVLSLFATALLGLLVARDVMGFGSLGPWALLATFGLLFLTGTFIVLRFWAVRMRHYQRIAGALTLQGIGRAVFPVAFGLAGSGWGGLVAGELAGRTFGIRSLGRLAWPRLRQQRYRHQEVNRLLGKYRQYWAVILPSSVLDALALALPVPVVVATYGLEAAGWWVLVNRVAMAPGQLVAAAVADVFHSETMRQLPADPGGPRRWLWSTLRPLLIGTVVVYACAGAVAPWAFGLVFGSEWAEAGRLMLLLVPALVVTVAVGATGRMLMVMQKSHWKLYADALNVAAPLAAFYGGFSAGWTFLQASAVFCLAYTFANGVYLAAIWHSTSPR
jgi:O-antigen/teichoic acid export membrane protein